jgi:Ca2+-transporting ATPase
VAVLVVSLVASGNDYQKDLQFRKLNAQKERVEIKVVRGGVEQLVLNTDLVVGDIVRLITGDKVAADGVLLASQGLVIDEASLTGESDPIKKSVEASPWVRCGTQVSEGSGTLLVTAVGVQSEWGRTMAMVVGETGDTPLQEALTVLAAAVGKVGLGVGVLCFTVLLIRWCVENRGFPVKQFAEGPLRFFIFAVTIIVVAVPEGLPLAVTISLAYSMRKMMKDNNFVRVLAACETMGGATTICSDKTGTLTENRMTVVAARLGGRGAALARPPPPREALDPDLATHLELNCALNSKAFLVEPKAKAAVGAEGEGEGGAAAGGKPTKKKAKAATGGAAGVAAAAATLNTSADGVGFVGNRTECALLMLLRGWGTPYKALRDAHAGRVVREYDFSSERKMASVLVTHPDPASAAKGACLLYAKGAAEIVVRRCVAAYSPGGAPPAPLGDADRDALVEEVTAMAASGLRTICLAQKDVPASALPGGSAPEKPFEDGLTLMGIVGIKDPVRGEVPAAVATCQDAGITVRMVTGDNIHTARHIAAECGILSEGGLAMEGPDFRALPEAELVALLPRLQVLARSSPADKLVLVRTLKGMGDIVAVTGDGTNDAPALKESDVGLAMGIAGTEVSKEAADIVILDDNFSSIVKAVMWGRSVFANIRKFLQFQLTVNFVALVVAFVAAVTNGETPLNVLQLLWVNLVRENEREREREGGRACGGRVGGGRGREK